MTKDKKPDADSKQAIDDVQMMLRSLGLADFGYQDQPQPDLRPSWAPARSQSAHAQPLQEPSAAKSAAASKPAPPSASEPNPPPTPAQPPASPASAQRPAPKLKPEQPAAAPDTSVSLRDAFTRLAARAPAAKPKGLKLHLDKVPQVSRPARSSSRAPQRDLRSVFGSMTARPPKKSS